MIIMEDKKKDLFNQFFDKMEGIVKEPSTHIPEIAQLDSIRNKRDLGILKDMVSTVGGGWDNWLGMGYTPPPVDEKLISDIAEKSEVVSAVVNQIVTDTMSVGYTFKPKPGVRRPAKYQKQRAEDVFNHPSKDDYSDKWMKNFIYDAALHANAYIELSGTRDLLDGPVKYGDFEVYDLFGYVNGINRVPSEGVRRIPLENGQTPDPPAPAYVQRVNGSEKYFTSNKYFSWTRNTWKDIYGISPILSLLMVVSGQIHLTSYIGNLFKGNIPKHLLLVEDCDDDVLQSMIRTIRQQMNVTSQQYGLVALNVPGSQIKIQRLFDSAQEGKFLETLRYYREEICAVFGVPPERLGWTKDGNEPTDINLDAYYDVIECYQHELEDIINNYILPKLNVTDWFFKFNTVRPKKDDLEATVFYKKMIGIREGRKINLLNINEGREILMGRMELPPILEKWADDYKYTPMQAIPTKPVSGERESPVTGDATDDDADAQVDEGSPGKA